MKRIKFTVSLESLKDKTGSEFINASSKTFVDGDGCEITSEDIVVNAEEFANSSYNQVKSTTLELPILLEQTYDALGMFTDFSFIVWSGATITDTTDECTRVVGLSENAYYSNLVNEYVTGYTVSYLDLVQGYNQNDPFQVDVNLDKSPNTSFTGVIGITGNAIQYVVNGDVSGGTYVPNTGVIYITYTDQTRMVYSEELENFVEILLTEFKTKKVGFVDNNISLYELVKEEMFFGIVEKRNTKNDVFFDRDTLSPFENHLRITEVQTVAGLKRYGNGFYNFN
jgi:hypothetical protein